MPPLEGTLQDEVNSLAAELADELARLDDPDFGPIPDGPREALFAAEDAFVRMCERKPRLWAGADDAVEHDLMDAARFCVIAIARRRLAVEPKEKRQ